MATKRIKFIKAYQMFGPGQEAALDAPIADLLIKNGRAEEVQTPTPVQTPAPDGKLKRRKKGKR